MLQAEPSVASYGYRVEKPWGWEEIWTETSYFTGKKLFVRAGHRLSLQYHDQKTESQCLVKGRARLLIEDGNGLMSEIEMEPGRGYTIVPFQRHRLIAVEDAEVMEVSTPEAGITVRLEDDYGRPDETEAARLASRPKTVP